MSIEYLFVETYNKIYNSKIITLCSRNETRNDVCMFDKYLFSIKYSSPNNSGNPSNVRLINNHSQTNKIYDVNEDILLVIPSFEIPQGKIYNFKTNRLCTETSASAKKLLHTNDLETIIQKQNERFVGKLVYIPKELIHHNDLHNTQDGVELKGTFVKSFIKKKENKKYLCNVNIRNLDYIQESDIVKVAIQHVTGNKLMYC